MNTITLTPCVFEYTGEAVKENAIGSQNGFSHPRNKGVQNALNKVGYKCEVDSQHPNLQKMQSSLNYTEPHHIVPCPKQDDFDNSLDVEENIISLCCNCHKQIHLGHGYEEMLEKYITRERSY
ncbi:HNH endonuclease [Pseudocitrobacter faecalis]|uniref:HNH endonuclease n=1 Tax=Pseudocitrobacter faecalis TaxID=1398493 RepID=UPI004063D607